MVSHKTDIKAVWPRNGHAASIGLNQAFFSLNKTDSLNMTFASLVTCENLLERYGKY